MKKQLLTLAVLAGFSGMMMAQTETDPYTVDAMLEATPDASEVWVQGYIVGAIEGKSIQDGAKFDISQITDANTNLLLASSSAEDNYAYCVAVQLPSGSVRSALNLVQHPENMGHEVKIKGKFEKYFGVPGLKSASAYEWVGEAPVAPEIPDLGTKENPATVAEVIAGAANGGNAWVKGYIVGYVESASGAFADLVHFSADGAPKTNIVLADEATTDAAKCIPVAIPATQTEAIRDVITLGADPANLGKQVIVYGVREMYYGAKGIKEVSDFAWADGSVVVPDPVDPSGDALWTGLNPSDTECDWTLDNGTLPEGLSYVWAWKSYKDAYYLNASAYLNGTNYAADAWAVSPMIDLGAATGLKVNFEHAAKFQNGNVQDEFGFAVRAEGGEWQRLTIPTMPTAGTWDFANSGDIDLSSVEGKKFQLGFNYVSTTSGADTWEIRSVKITGNEAGVAGIEIDGADAQYFTLQGVRVAQPESGLYIVVKNGKASKVLVK